MKYKKIYPHETLFLKKMILNICQTFVMIYMHLVIFYFTNFFVKWLQNIVLRILDIHIHISWKNLGQRFIIHVKYTFF